MDATTPPEERHLSSTCAADVAMQVDKTRQEVHAFAIEFAAAGPQAGAAGRIDRHSRVADQTDLGDAVVFNNEIVRTAGRSAVAVDEGHSANDQLREGSFSFLAVGRRFYLRPGYSRVTGKDQEKKQGQEAMRSHRQAIVHEPDKIKQMPQGAMPDRYFLSGKIVNSIFSTDRYGLRS